MVLRIIWAAMLLGQVMFLAVTMVFGPQQQAQSQSTFPQLLL